MSVESASLELSAAPTSAVLTVSPAGTITSWSPGAQRLYGWTREEAVGRPLLVLVPQDRRAEFEQLERRLRDGEQLDGVDTVRVAKDGRCVEVELHVVVLHDEAGRITGTVRVHHDRAPLRRAQEALLTVQRGLDDGFLSSPVPQARLRPDGVVLAVNPAVEQLLGMPADVLVGMKGMVLVAAGDQDESADVLSRLSAGAVHFEQREITLEPATGGPRRVLATTTTVRGAGEVVALHTSLQDVTDLRAAQERERAAAARFDALVQSMPVAVWTFDCAGVCTSSRGAALASLGLTDDELAGVDLLERDRDDPEPLGATLATLAGESTTLRRSVGGRDWESHFRPLRDDEGRVVGGIGIAVDVTERATAEREVAANEARLRALLRNADDVVIVLDVRGRMQWVSPAVTRVFGHDHVAMARRLAYDLNPPEDRPVIRAAWDRVARTPGGTAAFSVRVRHADGGYRWTDQVLTNLLHDPDIGGIVVNVRDVTRHRAAEQEVQRLALHDRLTGLANRALLLDRTEQAMGAGRRTGEQTGLVVVDVVGMTAVNDLVGQAGGDVVLRTLAERLASAVLGGDSVARLGADDFAVLVEVVASGEDLRARASMLLEAGQGEVVVDGVPVPLVLRAGSAMTLAAEAGALLAAAERS
ncbi:MAG: PAS domain S-box protein, partial [Frankiaceae bacterium]|nr:PAS domain S-box protein [Frankiaceae bacterium]